MGALHSPALVEFTGAHQDLDSGRLVPPSSTNRTVNKEDNLNVEFSYSVHWKQTHIPFERRMEKYSR